MKIKELISNAEIKRTENGAWYTFEELTKRGGKLVIYITLCTTPDGSNSIPALWKKNGHMDRVVPNFWSVDVYAYDSEGNCLRDFNPQHEAIKGMMQINFDWIFEATEENKQKLLEEILTLAYA